MNKIILALCLIALFSWLSGETTIPAGQVQGTWDATGSPYRIMGNISVQNSTALNIGPGVEVIFNGAYKLEVFGSLLCSGNEENHIVFTAQDTLNGWQSIRFTNNASANPPSSFSYTEFKFGRAINGTSPTDPMNCGGAIWANNAGTLSFDHCSFERCKSMGDGSVMYADNLTNLVLNHCSIKGCETEWFGAICLRSGSLNLFDTQFVNNSSNVFGAAMYLYECTEVNIISCVFMNNTAGAVAGIYSLYSPLVIKNSLFAGNYTDTGRGGAIGVTHGTTTLTNCTFAGNSSPMDGGAVWFNLLDAPATITNSVFWDNLPDAISTVTNTYTLSYCSMQVPQGGATNIYGNPLFSDPLNGDFSLQPNSPCIDAGTPDPEGLGLPPLDLAGLPRIVDGDMDEVVCIDMGCYEMPSAPEVGEISGQVTDLQGHPIAEAILTAGTQTAQTNEWGLYTLLLEEGIYDLSCSKAGYPTATHEDVVVSAGEQTIVNFCLEGVGNSDQLNVPSIVQISSYPNPFMEKTSLRINLPKQGSLRLDIYNLKGQRITSLFAGELSAGEHEISWNGLDDTNKPLGKGIYICRIKTNGETRTARLIKL